MNKYNQENEYNRPLNSSERISRENELREETSYQQQVAAKNRGAANGLLTGGILAALLGLGAAVYYYSNQPAPTPVNTTINYSLLVQQLRHHLNHKKRRKFIERTVEKAAPPKLKWLKWKKGTSSFSTKSNRSS